jgi:metal-responsive CopG/Arc/MetJ family transcriptional regulator
MTRFTVRLDDMTAAYFNAFAEQFGGRSQAMRALIEEALTTSRAVPIHMHLESLSGTRTNRELMRAKREPC